MWVRVRMRVLRARWGGYLLDMVVGLSWVVGSGNGTERLICAHYCDEEYYAETPEISFLNICMRISLQISRLDALLLRL